MHLPFRRSRAENARRSLTAAAAARGDQPTVPVIIRGASSAVAALRAADLPGGEAAADGLSAYDRWRATAGPEHLDDDVARRRSIAALDRAAVAQVNSLGGRLRGPITPGDPVVPDVDQLCRRDDDEDVVSGDSGVPDAQILTSHGPLDPAAAFALALATGGELPLLPAALEFPDPPEVGPASFHFAPAGVPVDAEMVTSVLSGLRSVRVADDEAPTPVRLLVHAVRQDDDPDGAPTGVWRWQVLAHGRRFAVGITTCGRDALERGLADLDAALCAPLADVDVERELFERAAESVAGSRVSAAGVVVLADPAVR